MAESSSPLPLSFDDLSLSDTATLTEPKGQEQEPDAKPHPPKWWKRKKIVLIGGGAVLVVCLLASLLTNYVFVEAPEEETTSEVPKHRRVIVSEIPLGKLRLEKTLPNSKGNAPQLAFIVELDASLVVHGTDSELLAMDQMIQSHRHRIEEAIDRIIRSAAPAELTEPETQTLRTRIRKRINDVCGEKLVQEVLFSHYCVFHLPIKR
jgi:flagellar basal body-associated protein FliL